MTTFLDTCPQGGYRILKDRPCPHCLWSAEATDPDRAQALQAEYRKRWRRHALKYALFMFLSSSLALVMMATAGIVYRGRMLDVYRGRFSQLSQNIGFDPDLSKWYVEAMFGLGILWLVLSGLLALTKWGLGWALYCPGCATRVDEVGLDHGRCPSCHVTLVRRTG